MVWLGQDWLGLAWELMKKTSGASNVPRGLTGGLTNWHKHAFRPEDQQPSNNSINEAWRKGEARERIKQLLTGSAPWIHPVMRPICKWSRGTFDVHRNPLPRWGFSTWQPNRRREGEAEPSDAAITTTLSGQANKKWIFQSGDLHGYLWWGPGTPTGTGTHSHTTLHTDTQRARAARTLHLPITDATIITSVSLCKCCQALRSLIYCTGFTIPA